MYATYETQIMSSAASIRFMREFDRMIGTDREIIRHHLGTHSVTCFELEENEVEMCRRIEQHVNSIEENQQ